MFIVLLLGGVDFSLLQSIAIPALHTLQTTFGTTTTMVAWIQTGYLLSASIATPLVGRLGDVYGKRPVFIAVLVVVAAGVLVSALAPSIEWLVAGRVLQGVAFSIFPLAFGIIRETFPEQRRATATAVMSVIIGAGASIGISVSGPIVETLSYHWLFWFPLMLVVVSIFAAILVLPDSPPQGVSLGSWLSAIPLAAWLVVLLVLASEGNRWGWASARSLAALALVALLVLIWVRMEARSAYPLVDMRTLRIRTIWTANAASLLINVFWFGAWISIPQLLQLPRSTGFGFGTSVTEAGIVFLPATLTMLAVSLAAGRIAAAFGARLPLALGSLLLASGFALLLVDYGSRFAITTSVMLMGAGIGLSFSAIAITIVDAAPPGQVGVVVGLNMITRTVGGAVGGQITAAIIAGDSVGGAPHSSQFALAFAIGTVGSLVAFALAGLVPSRVRSYATVERQAA